MKYSSGLRQSVGGHPYFAGVTLAIRKEPCVGLRVTFDDTVGLDWRGAAHFGIEYAWSKAIGSHTNHGVCVAVLMIQGMIADTTPVMVAYVAADAFWKAVSFVPEARPVLDMERNGIFFPR